MRPEPGWLIVAIPVLYPSEHRGWGGWGSTAARALERLRACIIISDCGVGFVRFLFSLVLRIFL